MRKTKKAALSLILIFGSSVATGLLAEDPKPLKPKVRREMHIRKPQRKPDGESPKQAVVIAVIDTGIDFMHPALRSHRWTNANEIPGNEIDDDKNGYVDDVNGFDFATRKGEVVDTHGHGTHIAGILVKENPAVELMNLKYFTRGMDGAKALNNSVEAMKYAILMKADIINYSGGGTTASPEELAVLTEANRQGILIVAAAGNEASNSERAPFYPANYNLSNIISVTAINEATDGDEFVPSSNFGQRSVAVAAQGKEVLSTMPGGAYGVMTGTSQATAFVAAAAAKMLQDDFANGARSTPEELIQRILGSSKSSEALKGKTKLGSKLSTKQAMAYRGDSKASLHLQQRRKLVQSLNAELSTQAKLSPYGL